MIEKYISCPKCDSFEVDELSSKKYECIKCGCKFKLVSKTEEIKIENAGYPEPYLTLAR